MVYGRQDEDNKRERNIVMPLSLRCCKRGMGPISAQRASELVAFTRHSFVYGYVNSQLWACHEKPPSESRALGQVKNGEGREWHEHSIDRQPVARHCPSHDV